MRLKVATNNITLKMIKPEPLKGADKGGAGRSHSVDIPAGSAFEYESLYWQKVAPAKRIKKKRERVTKYPKKKEKVGACYV
jgi:hypothetical protein